MPLYDGQKYGGHVFLPFVVTKGGMTPITCILDNGHGPKPDSHEAKTGAFSISDTI